MRARERIERLKQALVRLDNGVYVSCASCGNEIESERLELLPATTVCATCAKG